MKVMTLNTHSWMEDDPEKKFAQLVKFLAQESCDLICLQEVNQLLDSPLAEKIPGYVAVSGSPAIHEDNYALLLVQSLRKHGLTFHWSWAYNHIGYDIYQEGVAILSRTTLVPATVQVSASDDETDFRTRRVLLAETTVAGRVYRLASLHLSWWDKGFQGEWRLLQNALADSDLPLILAGDFNNPTSGPGYEHILDSPLGLVDSHLVAQHSQGDHTIQADIDGWEGNARNLKVDHIFVSQGTQVTRSSVVCDGQDTPRVSDHFGLLVEMSDDENV